MSLARGAIVGGRYTVDAVLGEGAFAVVYAVTHLWLGTPHALKVLHARFDDTTCARLLAEGRIQAHLSHPNLVRVTDVVELDGGVGLVMDRVHGETLRARLARGPLPREEAIAIGAGILAGLAAAHDAGLVHRDVKPANILLDPDGTPRISDFGLASSGEKQGAGTSQGASGTFGYLPPEYASEGARGDPRLDVFSVGCVLYELLAGVQAFPADARQPELARRGELVPVEDLAPDLAPHLMVAVAVALSAEPEGRPRTARELAALWSGADEPSAPRPLTEAGRPSEASASPTVPTGARWRRFGWAGLGVLGAGILGAALLARAPTERAPRAWNADVAATFAAHLAKTGLPHADNVARLTSQALDAWYDRAAREQAAWESMRDADPDALKPRRHLACLEGALLAADATVASLLARDPLTTVDGGIGNPLLPDLDLCAEATGDRAWSLPDEPGLRAQILALSARPVSCLELSWLNKEEEADACYAAGVAEADRLGYAPARVRMRTQWLDRALELGPLSPAVRAELDAALREADELGLEVELAELLLLAARADGAAGERAEEAIARARTLTKRLGWPVSLHHGLLSREREQARAAGRWQEAVAISATARDLRCARSGERTADCAWEHLVLADALFDEGRVDEAIANDMESLHRYREALGETHPEQIHARFFLARHLIRVGRVREAAEWLEPVPALRARHPSGRVLATHLLLGACALGRGRLADVDTELAAAAALGLPYEGWDPLRVALVDAVGVAKAGSLGDAWARVAPVVTLDEGMGYACASARACPAFQQCDEGRCVPLPAEIPVP